METSKRDSKKHSKEHKDHKSKENKEKEKDRKDQSNKKKSKRTKSSDSSDNDDRRQRSISPYDKKSSKKRHIDDSSNSASVTNGGAEKLELSIDETNELRKKLGLKPLQLNNKSEGDKKENNVSAGGNKIYRDKKTDEVFEHVPAKDITAAKEENKLRERLDEQRKKRELIDKFRVKGLGDTDSEDDSASTWTEKLKAKQEADKKAKLLEEMDRQVEEEAERERLKKKQKQINYTERDLRGLNVEHDQENFKEGQSVILTLKDKNVLDEENDDVLINVNIADDEKAAKNIENKKKKPAYKPYEEFDEFGNFVEKSILDKYDEELDGEKKKSFKLGAGGVYDSSMDKFIQQQNDEYKSRAIKLDLSDLKVAKDYMTKEEQEAFKKPKKIRKKLRKVVKADDLLPLDDEEESRDFGSRKRIKKESEDMEMNEDEIREKRKKELSEAEATAKTIKLEDIDFSSKKSSRNRYDSDEDNENEENNKLIENDKLNIKIEDDVAFNELHNVLDKVRKRVVTNKIDEIAKRILEENEKNEESKMEIKNEPMTNFDELENEEASSGNYLTLDSMSEFCRNLDVTTTRSVVKNGREDYEKSTASASKNINEEDEYMNYESNSDEDDDEDDDKKKKNDNINETDAQPILDDEPVIDRGLASALALAVNKGYLVEQKQTQNARIKENKKDDLSALNYTIEEKNFYDIDDKYSRNRDRFSGPLSDFKEKEGYKPDIKLEYVDEKGHRMNEKEAFRYQSHRFHGKGPGKKKTEKRMNKFKELESMNKMSSIDTPLNTVALMMEKQKKLQQPYVVLSAPKAEKNEIPLHKR